jgi:hypothetical protein
MGQHRQNTSASPGSKQRSDCPEQRPDTFTTVDGPCVGPFVPFSARTLLGERTDTRQSVQSFDNVAICHYNANDPVSLLGADESLTFNDSSEPSQRGWRHVS